MASVAIILAIIWLFYYEMKIKGMENQPANNKCSAKMDYFEYVTTKQKTTEEAVKKLQESEDYKRFLLEKSNPNSKYNRRDEEEVEEIVLSDDSDEDAGKKYQ